MKIKDIALSAAYVGQRVVKAICVGAQEIWSAVKYIVFKDPVVEQICATNWGDGVGITEEQAAKVLSIYTIFQGNNIIAYFDEFVNFVGISSLYEGCFKNSSLKSIVLPPNIVSLMTDPNNDIEGCFYNCSSLVRVVLNHGLKEVGGGAFRKCASLSDVSLPNTVEIIKGYAFIGTKYSEDLDAPNLIELGTGAFFSTHLRKIANLGKITSLESTYTDGTFERCEYLEEATLPQTLTKIGGETFSGCTNLKTVVMNSYTPPTLGNDVFLNTHADLAIYVPDQSVQAYREASGWLNYADRIWPMEAYLYGIITFADPAVEAICVANWDTNGTGFLNKEEAKAVTDLGTVFQGNTEITSFDELAEFENVTELKLDAFRGCTSLTSIDLSNITTFGNYAFLGCSSLSMNLSFLTLTKFGGLSVFDGADIRSLYMPMLETAEQGAFNNCKNFTGELNYPNLKGEIGMIWMAGTAITKIVNLGEVTAIRGGVASGAFNNCKSLTYVNLPATLTSIGEYGFQGCSALQVFICNATTPPTCDAASVFWNCNNTFVIYVPDASIDAYKAKEVWSTYADRIKPLSEYVES